MTELPNGQGLELSERRRLDRQTIRMRLRQLRRIEADEASEATFASWRASRPRIGTKPGC